MIIEGVSLSSQSSEAIEAANEALADTTPQFTERLKALESAWQVLHRADMALWEERIQATREQTVLIKKRIEIDARMKAIEEGQS